MNRSKGSASSTTAWTSTAADARYQFRFRAAAITWEDWSQLSLVPWEPRLLEFLTLNAKTTHLLVILQKKLHGTEFCVPIQGVYEPMLPEGATDGYHLVADGEYYSVSGLTKVTKEVSYANLNEMPANRHRKVPRQPRCAAAQAEHRTLIEVAETALRPTAFVGYAGAQKKELFSGPSFRLS